MIRGKKPQFFAQGTIDKYIKAEQNLKVSNILI